MSRSLISCDADPTDSFYRPGIRSLVSRLVVETSLSSRSLSISSSRSTLFCFRSLGFGYDSDHGLALLADIFFQCGPLNAYEMLFV